jgi:hypothetical protein
MLLRGVVCGSAIDSGTAQLESMVKLLEGFHCTSGLAVPAFANGTSGLVGPGPEGI